MATYRPSRINPDTLPVLVLAVLLTAGLAGVSFTISYAALQEVSAWAAVPASLAWTVPVMLDAATVVYLLAVLVKRARHEHARGAWAALALWTAVSVVANATHAAGVPESWERAVGTVVAALAPIAVLLAIHTIADLITVRTHTEPEPTASAEADTDTTPDEEPDEQPERTDTDTPPGTASAAGPSAVRRHPSPRPRTRVRAVDLRDDIVRLRGEGLSVRAIAERVGCGKTAVAELLRGDAMAA